MPRTSRGTAGLTAGYITRAEAARKGRRMHGTPVTLRLPAAAPTLLAMVEPQQGWGDDWGLVFEPIQMAPTGMLPFPLQRLSPLASEEGSQTTALLRALGVELEEAPSPQRGKAEEGQQGPCAPWVVQISNVMATGSVGCALDLRTVARRLMNAEQGMRKTTCLMRLRFGHKTVTAELFTSGNVHVFGARSEAEAQRSFRRVVCRLHWAGYWQAKVMEVSVKNVVGTVDYHCQFDLEAFYLWAGTKAFYCTEHQPGVSYHMQTPVQCELTVHHTGRVVFMGASSERDVVLAAEAAEGLLHPFVRASSPEDGGAPSPKPRRVPKRRRAKVFP